MLDVLDQSACRNELLTRHNSLAESVLWRRVFSNREQLLSAVFCFNSWSSRSSGRLALRNSDRLSRRKTAVKMNVDFPLNILGRVTFQSHLTSSSCSLLCYNQVWVLSDGGGASRPNPLCVGWAVSHALAQRPPGVIDDDKAMRWERGNCHVLSYCKGPQARGDPLGSEVCSLLWLWHRPEPRRIRVPVRQEADMSQRLEGHQNTTGTKT